MRAFLKAVMELTAAIAIIPLHLIYCISGTNCCQRKFTGWSQWMSLWPGISGVYLRREFYRRVFSQYGADAQIWFGTTFSHPTVQIGERVYIGVFCSIGDVSLGDDVHIASHVSIINGGRQHDVGFSEVPRGDQAGAFPKVTIRRNAWIGERAVVMCDVGEGAIVGAGAVVTKPVPDFAVVVGVPAQVLRYNRPGDVLTTDSELPAAK